MHASERPKVSPRNRVCPPVMVDSAVNGPTPRVPLSPAEIVPPLRGGGSERVRFLVFGEVPGIGTVVGVAAVVPVRAGAGPRVPDAGAGGGIALSVRAAGEPGGPVSPLRRAPEALPVRRAPKREGRPRVASGARAGVPVGEGRAVGGGLRSAVARAGGADPAAVPGGDRGARVAEAVRRLRSPGRYLFRGEFLIREVGRCLR